MVMPCEKPPRLIGVVTRGPEKRCSLVRNQRMDEQEEGGSYGAAFLFCGDSTPAGAEELIQFQRSKDENPQKGEDPHNIHEWP